MSRRVLMGVVTVFLMVSCSKDKMPELIELDTELENSIRAVQAAEGNLSYYILPDDTDLDAIPQDRKNPLNEAKVELGKFLFFETGFAMNAALSEGTGTYSCATCHIPSAGFKPGSFQGVADGGEDYGINGEDRRRQGNYTEALLDVQSARPLTLVNVAYVTNTMWNGSFGSQGANIGTESVWNHDDGTDLNDLGFEAIETQNFEGLEVHRILINETLINAYGYKTLFDEAFPDLTDDLKYSNYGGSLAISAYIRTILSTEAPFQKWLKGDKSAMSAEEKRGALLFFGKGNCSACHFEENLGSQEFHALGVKDMYQRPSFDASPSDKRNLGRGGFTLIDEDNYKFKVPGLYNVSDTPFYFHGSSKTSLEEVIDYKAEATLENSKVPETRMSEKFLPLDLTEEEKAQLVAFLAKSLRDPDLNRYMPSEVLSGQCFPNNDRESRSDLGCN